MKRVGALLGMMLLAGSCSDGTGTAEEVTGRFGTFELRGTATDGSAPREWTFVLVAASASNITIHITDGDVRSDHETVSGTYDGTAYLLDWPGIAEGQSYRVRLRFGGLDPNCDLADVIWTGSKHEVRAWQDCGFDWSEVIL